MVIYFLIKKDTNVSFIFSFNNQIWNYAWAVSMCADGCLFGITMKWAKTHFFHNTFTFDTHHKTHLTNFLTFVRLQLYKNCVSPLEEHPIFLFVNFFFNLIKMAPDLSICNPVGRRGKRRLQRHFLDSWISRSGLN